MSLKAIGAVSNILNFDLDNLNDGKNAVVAMQFALKGLTTDQVAAASSTLGLNAAQYAIASSAAGAEAATIGVQLATKGYTTEVIAAALSTAGFSEAEINGIINSEAFATAQATAAGATGTLTASLAAATKGIIAFLTTNPIGWAIGAAAIIGGVALAYDALTVSFAEASEAADKAAQELDDSKSELKNLEDEIDSLNEKIKELQALKDAGTISLTDEAELGRLQRQVEILERQKAIQERLVALNQISAAKTANAALNNKGFTVENPNVTYTTYKSQGVEYRVPNGTEYQNVNIIDKIKDEQKQLDEIANQRAILEEKKLAILNSSSADDLAEGGLFGVGKGKNYDSYKAILDQLDNLDVKESSLTESLTEHVGEVNTLYESLFDDQGNVIEGYEDTARACESLFDFLLDDTEKASKLEKNIVDILNKPDFGNLKDRLARAATEGEDAVKYAIDSTYGLNDAIGDAGLSVDEFIQYVMSGFQEIPQSVDDALPAFDRLKNRFEEIKEQFDGVSSSISAVKNVLSSQSTGNSISIEDFNSDELKDYTSALEYNNGVLQLNAEKVSEIVEAKTEEAIATNEANKAMAQSQYLENAKQIEKLRAKIRDNNLAEGESVELIQTEIDSLLNKNSVLKTTCDGYDVMSASLREATDAYHNWLNAQNAAESGDMFDDTLNAINHIVDTLNNQDSDLYGRVGREDYKAAVGLIIPDSVDAEDAERVNAYLDSIYSLFTYDDSGNRAGLNIKNFCEQAVEEGLMVLDEASEEYKIAGQKTMEDFAEGLNLSMPLVQAMFGEMEEFGGEFTWADEANKTIGDLAVAANVAAENLRGLNQDMVITLDVSDLENTEEQIASLEGTIAQMQEHKTTIPVDSSEVEYANSIISYCVTQIQQLEDPAIMQVDTSKVSAISQTASDAVASLQEFKREYNNLEMKKSLGLNTADAEAKLNSLKEQISQTDNAYIIDLDLDTTSIESLNESISKMGLEEVKVAFKIDDKELIDYEAEDKEAKVIYDIDTTNVDRYNPKNLKRKVTYYVETVETVTQSVITSPSVNTSSTKTVKKVSSRFQESVASFTGTAFAGGNWGTAIGGKTLVGELGREIVVDPHTGKWYTVGDRGAEFVHVPRGSIVFNHKQTESLLQNGYVSGRATALVSGTAMVGGGISTKGADDSTVSGGNSTSNYTKSKSDSSTKTKEEEERKKEKEKEEEELEEEIEEKLSKIDWIETAIDRVERSINKLKTTAESTYKSLKTRLGAAYDAITEVNQEIALQQKAYERYMQQANSVGLSADLAAKVRNGSIDIEEYDSETQELIDDYREWYEKALDCADAIDTLHESLADMYMDNFNNVQKDFENQLSLLEHLTNTYETGLDELEARGYLVGSDYYAAMQDVERQNIGVLEQELASLTKEFSIAMASGEIEKGSEAWYDMQISITGVKESIQEANVKMLEFAKSMREVEWDHFDYLQDRISQITDESDFFIELMGHKKLVRDDGKFTNEGMATLGLMTQNYNVYMAQADKYAEEIRKIDSEIANDPYNTDLIERREELLGLQQDAILAAEDEKEAIIDLVEDGIDSQIDAMKELIDAYKDNLDSAKDLYEYQKKIEDKSKDIASLQKQLSAYENDDSEEARAKIQQIKVDLAEAQEDLAETQYDKYISDTKKLLDNLYTEYESLMNERLDDVDALIEEVIDMVNANANTVSDALYGNTLSISETLEQVSGDVGYTMTSAMYDIWNSAGDVVARYGEDFTSKLTTINSVLNAIEVNTQNMIAASNALAQSVIASTTTTTEPDSKYFDEVPTTNETQTSNTNQAPVTKPEPPVEKVPAQQETTNTSDTSALTDKDYYGVALAIWNGGYGWGLGNERKQKLREKGFDPTRIMSIVNEMGREGAVHTAAWIRKYYGIAELSPYHYNKYLKGGLIDYTGIAQVDGTPGKPEMVLNPNDTKNFLGLRDVLRSFTQKDFKTEIPAYQMPTVDFSGLSDISGILSKMTRNYSESKSQYGDINFEINIDHVEDYNDFVTKLQQDKQFERMIRSMTTDQLTGGSTLAKYKYRMGK